MAKRNRTTTARRNAAAARNTRNTYVEGSAVRKLSEVPERRNYPPSRRPAERRRSSSAQPREAARQAHTLSKAAQKNREKAMSMTKAFVIFLAMVCVAVLFFCIHYLQLKSEITASMKNVASLEADLSQLKEDNDAYYSQVTSNVDLSRIKKIAIGRLGMKYPSEEQIMTYKSEGSSYVRQYQDVPDSK